MAQQQKTQGGRSTPRDNRSDDSRQRMAAGDLPAKIEAYKASILTPERRNELTRVIPQHVAKDLFERNLGYALQKETRLLSMSLTLVFAEVAKLTGLGLILDPHLGEAYVIVAWDGRLRAEVPQGRVGYRGLMKIARGSDEIGIIYASEVCAHDLFKEQRGSHKNLVHEPKTFSPNRGEIIGYYAHVTYREPGNPVDFECMDIEDVHRIRNRSDGYKAFQEEKISKTPWVDDEVEMAKKTVIRRLCKRLPQSPDLTMALKIEDEAEFQHLQDITPTPGAKLIAPRPVQQQLEHQRQETVETKAQPDREREPAREEHRDQPAQEQQKPKQQAQQKPAAQQVAFDPTTFFRKVEDAYRAAKTEAEVAAVWPKLIVPHSDDLMPLDLDELGNMRDEALERVRG